MLFDSVVTFPLAFYHGEELCVRFRTHSIMPTFVFGLDIWKAEAVHIMIDMPLIE